MKKLLLTFFTLLLLVSMKSQSLDSIITYKHDSVMFKSIYNRNIELNKTEVLFYNGDNLSTPYAKWLFDGDLKDMTYFRDDTIYFKTTTEDLGDIKIDHSYYLNNGEWELQWSSIHYYSLFTYNVEKSYESELIVYQNGKQSVLVKLINPDDLLDDIVVYDSSGRVVDKFSNIKMNKVRLNITSTGLFIIYVTKIGGFNNKLLEKKKIILY